MASIVEVFDSVAYQVHTHQSGDLNFEDFNKRSKIAEIKMLGWLTGSPETGKEQNFVTPYDNQKSKDWLSPLIKPYRDNLVDGKLTKPKDYYGFENMYYLIAPPTECDEEEAEEIKKKTIDLLNGDEFVIRSNTFIKSLRPEKKPIAKEVGDHFEFLPKDLGSVELEYISYPEKYGRIVVKKDDTFNEEVIDTTLSQDYIWGDWAVEVLSWFIIQSYGIRVREGALFQMNEAKGKQP